MFFVDVPRDRRARHERYFVFAAFSAVDKCYRHKMSIALSARRGNGLAQNAEYKSTGAAVQMRTSRKTYETRVK